jgi:hypothetical protein
LERTTKPAAQLLEIARWITQTSGNHALRLETRGIRSQTIGLLAAALQPQAFSEIVVREGMKSFAYLQEKPVEFQQAADLFCFGLYNEFDIDRLEKQAGGTAPRHCLACGHRPYQKRTKYRQIYRYLPLLTQSNLFRVNSR